MLQSGGNRVSPPQLNNKIKSYNNYFKRCIIKLLINIKHTFPKTLSNSLASVRNLTT